MKEEIFTEVEMIKILDLMRRKESVENSIHNSSNVLQFIQSIFKGREGKEANQLAIQEMNKIIESKISKNQRELKKLIEQEEKIANQIDTIHKEILGSSSINQ